LGGGVPPRRACRAHRRRCHLASRRRPPCPTILSTVGTGSDDDLPAGSSSRGWEEADRARVLAERQAAIARLAELETRLDQADAYAETILHRLEVALNGGDAASDPAISDDTVPLR
jgi:hypothetical protein